MPKTDTSDIAQALPGSIDGPFLVADPADADSFIKIDPGQAEISAAGSARPKKRISLGYIRTAGTTASNTLGTGISCRQVNAGNDGGFFAALLAVPLDMDVTEPVSIFLLIAAAVNSAMSGGVVRLEVVAGYAKDGQSTPHTTTIAHNQTVPDSWQTNNVEIVLVDDGNGRTFAPDLFEAGDIIGLRIRLQRSNAADTFDQAVKLGAGAAFEYTAKIL